MTDVKRPAKSQFLFSAFVGLAIAVGAGLSWPVTSRALSAAVDLCFSNQRIIGASDLTYVGAIRMPQNGVDASNAASPSLTGRIVNGQVRFFIYGKRDQTSGESVVYELADPGSGYSTDYTQAPRASLVTDWGNIYHGKRVEYAYPNGPNSANGAVLDFRAQSGTAGIYWNESTQLLYWVYYNNYDGNSHPYDSQMGASSLDNPSTKATTAYGPWRTKATDGDGNTWYGQWRCQYMTASPIDGSMMCISGLAVSGATQVPWGPTLYSRSSWPTGSTAAGWQAPDLSLPKRMLNYYFMGAQQASVGRPWVHDRSGELHGDLRSFRRRTDQAVFEYFDAAHFPNVNFQNLRVNPALNGGVGSWSDMDSVTGGIMIETPTKRGMIFSAVLAGHPLGLSQPNNCSAAHEWYTNSGVGTALCPHGCAPLYPNAGPVSTSMIPALIVYDPTNLDAVAAGAVKDYTVEPYDVINLDTFNIKTAANNEQGWAKNIAGFFYDPARQYLFVLAGNADNTRASWYREPLIHVFKIN
jgi:hypothetical protein